MRARLYFLGLLLGNLLWSAHPIMGKILLRVFTPAEAAWLRYGSAWVAFAVGFLAVKAWRRGRAPKLPEADLAAPRPAAARPVSGVDVALLALIGLLNFCLAPWLQLSGLAVSHASDNALIVAMEPLITVGLAWVFLRDPLSPQDRAGFALALFGFCVLSGPTAMADSVQGSLRFFGNFALLLSMFGESTFSVGSAKLVSRRREPAWIFGIALTVGFFALTLVLLATGRLDVSTLAARIGRDQVIALLWLGPVGTTASYLFWIHALRYLNVASVALSLFIQPVFGTILAAVFLSEPIGSFKLIGGALILAALALSAFQPRAER